MKINRDDITTLNQIKFGYDSSIELRPGSQWLEVEGVSGIAGMTNKAFLFNHELGQAWVPKSAVKFEMKIGCDPIEPEYRVYVASWFNWTEKIELMKQGKIYSDEYLARRQRETEVKFSTPPPIIEWIKEKAESEKALYNGIIKEEETQPGGRPISKGIDFEKRNKERQKKVDLLTAIQVKEVKFQPIALKFKKKRNNDKIDKDSRMELIKAAIELWDALGAFTEAGFNFTDDQADMYEQLDDLIDKLKKKQAVIEKGKSNKDRAIDL